MNRVGSSSVKRNKRHEEKNNKIKKADFKEKEKKKEVTKKPKKNNQKQKKSHPILKFFGNILLILIIVIAVLGGIFYAKMQANGGGMQGALCALFGQSIDDLNNIEPINILLLGVSEDIGVELTDTIMVCNYNPKTEKMTMLSIPRDTFIGKSPNSAKGSDKINSLYNKDISKTIKAVNDLTGLDIKYYAVVRNTSLIKIVDILGGVDFEVPIDMDYDDPTQDLHIHLSKGMQKIDGPKAEQLLRFRHNNDGTSYPLSYGDNDFGRMRTQREFIKATANQTVQPQNIWKAKIIYNSVMENVDTNIDKDIIYPYIPKLATFDSENMVSIQLPGEAVKYNELWFFKPYKKETTKIIAENFQ